MSRGWGWYIAGPMRGLPEFNFPAFFECENYINSSKGVWDKVFNPARVDTDGGFEWQGTSGTNEELVERGFDLASAMKADLEFIVNEGTHIVMLPGWEQSTGARLEKQVAEILGQQVWYYDPNGSLGNRFLLQPLSEREGEGESVLAVRYSVAEEAARTVGERRLSYGSPRQDFERAADLFYYASGEKHLLTAPEIAVLQMCVKLSRRVTSPEKRDHMVDIAGYADCYWQVMEDNDG